MPLSPIVLRLAKGSELTPGEMDGNLSILRDFVNTLEQLFLVSFDEDGNPNLTLLSSLTGASYGDGNLSASVYSMILDPAPTTYTAGMKVLMRALSANTGPVDVNLNSLGAKSILKNVSSELSGGEIPLNGIVELVYDGTNFQMVTVYTGISASQLDEPARNGLHQYAAGVFSAGVYSMSLSPAPTSYATGMRVVFKPSAANTGSTDINLNGLGVKSLFKNTSEELIAGDISANGIVEAIYDGTNFQLLTTQSTFSTFTSEERTIPASGEVGNLEHSLGAVPSQVRWVLVCKTAEAGYVESDEIDAAGVQCTTAADPAFIFGANATHTFCCKNTKSSGTGLLVLNKTSGSETGLTLANWKAKAYCRI